MTSEQKMKDLMAYRIRQACEQAEPYIEKAKMFIDSIKKKLEM